MNCQIVPPFKPLVPNRPTPLGYEAGAELDRLFNASLEASGEVDKRCHECAFRKGTIPNGCEATIYDAVMCVISETVFECHINKGATCEGFARFKDCLPTPIIAGLIAIVETPRES